MELHFEELLSKITDFMKSEIKTETVIGQPFELGEFKCVPVIKVGLGFGSGGGEGVETKGQKKEGMGVGGGIGIEPIGFLVSRGENISFLAAGKTHGLSAMFEKAPDLIEKMMKNRAKEPEAV
jgi:uncharacterized spore protein YtfJ